MKKIFMAALLLGAFAFIVPSVSNAQLVSITKPVAAKDTLTNTDTTTVSIAVDNISRSVEIRGVRASGNVGTSKMYLQGTIDGTNYDNLDSLVFTNQVTNRKVINLRTTSGDLIYKTYRAYCLSAGTCTWSPFVYLLRRSN